MSLNTGVMFGKASDEWETPQELFDRLDAEFDFRVDAAANWANHKCPIWFGDGGLYPDALSADDWRADRAGAIWLNPPYSRVRAFMAKAAQEARKGCVVVCLVPARTDTRWWHSEVWDVSTNAFRPGVEVRFLPGRLKFGNSANSAPFPSVVIIFRGTP